MKKSYKLYLTLLLSSAFIFFFQYQLSIANIVTSSPATSTSSVAQNVPEAVPLIRSLRLQDYDGVDVNTRSTGSTSSSSTSTTSTTTTTTSTTPRTTTSPPTSLNNAGGDGINPTATNLNGHKSSSYLPRLYIITPTYKRPEQLAEITRLGYTLKHVRNVFWLVIEDAETKTELVTKLLEEINVPFVHLTAQMPVKYRKMKVKPRGVSNRNRGLEWIRKNATDGVMYFADDDNTYNLQIFEQMRYTKKVSMWPVGLITKFGVSSPIVTNGKITGFYDGWIGGRTYPVDMAGFAVNVKFLLSRPKAAMPFKPGYEEDGFLKSLAPLKLNGIEVLASNCTEILTWHTQSKKNPPAAPLDMKKHGGTNLVALRSILV